MEDIKNFHIGKLREGNPLKGKLPVKFLNKYNMYNMGEIAWLPEEEAKRICSGVRPAAELQPIPDGIFDDEKKSNIEPVKKKKFKHRR